ncbi:MAG: LacI family transcriptional regulator [Solirubrobacteraceae bacterium]|jgi:LacI family transcriptional regulator|nr:LacI family transcriptional regulator [Solirubrobacteraceae bacterium]
MNGPLTSSDIAREAGVSQATVSRVLNGSDRVAPGTRDRVLAVIERHGYAPSALARGLVTNRSQLIGVIVADITNPFYPEFIEAIGESLAARELRMLFYNGGLGDEEAYVRLLLEHRVEGIIFTSALRSSQAVRRLVDERFPLVLTNRSVDGADCDVVVGDNPAGAQAAAQHLLDLGHRRIGLITGHAEASTSVERAAAFATRLEAAGVELPAHLVRDAAFDQAAARRVAVEMLTGPDQPTALMCVNDVMAFGALNAARSLGLRVPEDVSVMGFDDIPMAGWEAFRLTTVRQPLAEMARASVRLLSERIAERGRPAQRLVYPSDLIVRDTTAVPAPDRRAAEARR